MAVIQFQNNNMHRDLCVEYKTKKPQNTQCTVFPSQLWHCNCPHSPSLPFHMQGRQIDVCVCGGGTSLCPVMPNTSRTEKYKNAMKQGKSYNKWRICIFPRKMMLVYTLCIKNTHIMQVEAKKCACYKTDASVPASYNNLVTHIFFWYRSSSTLSYTLKWKIFQAYCNMESNPKKLWDSIALTRRENYLSTGNVENLQCESETKL